MKFEFSALYKKETEKIVTRTDAEQTEKEIPVVYINTNKKV